MSLNDITHRRKNVEDPEQLLERVARSLCKARGVDPDSLVAYDNGTWANAHTYAWALAARELKAALLLADHVAMLTGERRP